VRWFPFRRTGNITCQALVSLLTDYLDGALPEGRRSAVARHLSRCEDCQEYLDQLRITIGLTGRLHVDDVPPATMDRLMDAFRNWQP
jgi:anti-sigma factor RsiW